MVHNDDRSPKGSAVQDGAVQDGATGDRDGGTTPGLDLPAVGELLAEKLGDEGWRDSAAKLIAGGKSNLTYRLTSPAGSVILRRPPTGDLLPKAHDMGREARIQSGLAGTDVPVAQILLNEGPELLGAPFYVMSDVPGVVIDTELPQAYAETLERREAIGGALIDTLVALHRVVPAEVGLDDYGRPDGFLARQAATWKKQWELSKFEELPDMDLLGQRLSEGVPTAQRTSIVHGDFKLNNLLLNPDDPGRVNAVLDWELSTLGDPLADVGMLMFYWSEVGDGLIPISAVTAQPGFLTRADLAERYAEGTGADLSDLNFYIAYSHFKFAAIMQGVYMRSRGGSMGGQDFGDLGEQIRQVAANGLAILNDGR